MAKIHEVAKAAGVSISTVSYALSGKRTISAETRQRIEQAVRELDYRPERRRPNARRPTHEHLRAHRAVPRRHPRPGPHGVRARHLHRRPALRLRHAAPHRGGGLGRHAPGRLERARRRRAGARRRTRRRARRISRGSSHAVGVRRRSRRPRRTRVRRPRLRGGGRRSPSTASPTLGHRSIGLVGHPPVAYERSNFPPRVRAGFERRAAELGIAAAVALPEPGGQRGVAVSAPRCASLLDRGATAWCCTATTRPTGPCSTSSRQRASPCPATSRSCRSGRRSTPRPSIRRSTRAARAAGVVRPRGRPRHAARGGRRRRARRAPHRARLPRPRLDRASRPERRRARSHRVPSCPAHRSASTIDHDPIHAPTGTTPTTSPTRR